MSTRTPIFEPTAAKRPYPDKPDGVGGWLGLLVIGLGLSAVRYLYSNWDDIVSTEAKNPALIGAPLWNQLKYSIVGIAVLQAVLAMGAALMLGASRKRSTPGYVMLLLVTLTMVMPVVEYAVVYLISPSSAQAVAQDCTTQFILGTIYFAVWGSYLRFSKRVRNTYVD